MASSFLPLIAIPAAALVLGLRRPSGPTRGAAAMGVQLSRAAVAIGMLIACGWFILVIASYVREWGCPGGFDGAGACLEKGAWDFGPTGIVLLSLPLAAAVALALRPVTIAPPLPPQVTLRRASGAAAPAPEPESEPKTETKAQPEPEAAEAPEPEPEPASPSEAQAEPPPALEGAVEKDRVEGESVAREAAMVAARGRIGERPGVVFSPYVNDEANQALAELAEALAAKRYLAFAPGGVAAAPNAAGAKSAAGWGAAHASELALDLAGGAVDSLILLDARVEFSSLALSALARVGSVCIADEHNEISAAVDVLLAAPSFDADGGHASDDDGPRALAAEGEAECRRAELVDTLRKSLAPVIEKRAATRPPSSDFDSLFAPPSAPGSSAPAPSAPPLVAPPAVAAVKPDPSGPLFAGTIPPVAPAAAPAAAPAFGPPAADAGPADPPADAQQEEE